MNLGVYVNWKHLSVTSFKIFKTVFRSDSGIDFSVGHTKEPVVIVGTENSDVIQGGKDSDLIYGGSGRDIIKPGAGNDIISIGGEYSSKHTQVNNELHLEQGHHFLVGDINDLIKLHINLIGKRT